MALHAINSPSTTASLLTHSENVSKLVPSVQRQRNPRAFNHVQGGFINELNKPGDPIVSAAVTVTEPLSSYVNFLIMVFHASFHFFLMDTNRFLKDILDLHDDNALLVIASLYTNISHDDGVQSVLHAHDASLLGKRIDSSTVASF